MSPLFPHTLDFNPSADFPSFLKSIPAKWVVYLLADSDDRPIQLLCVKNFRHSLERRLSPDTPEERTKRVNYRDFVRRIHWRRVDSPFESDLLYWEAARTLFPATYQTMMTHRPAWFLQVDPSAPFPRFLRTTDLNPAAGQLIGPLEDKQDAQKLIQLAEDAFDLCRYYNILTEAPAAKACAYKEMGRCPAPCDGTVSIDHYRSMISAAAHAMVDPSNAIAELTTQMKQAAAELKFEQAGRIKASIDQLSQFAAGPFRHARRLEDFQFLILQRGPKPDTAKLFLATPTGIEELAGLIAEPKNSSDLLRQILTAAADHARSIPDAAAPERVGLVAHHLFMPKRTQGIFLRVSELADRSLLQAYRDLKKQKEPEPPADTSEEGVVREAQITSVSDVPPVIPGK